ncbi:MAG: ribosome-binding factor A [Patescibacteria group bacterium]
MLERRLRKINELIQRFVGEMLRRELDTDALVTVSSVATSGNGQDCTIGISVFPFEKSPEVFKQIQKQVYEFQQTLNRGLAMRPVPKITFKLDESEEKGGRILREIDNLTSPDG